MGVGLVAHTEAHFEMSSFPRRDGSYLEVTKMSREDDCFCNVVGLTTEEAKTDKLGSRMSQMLEPYCVPSVRDPTAKLLLTKVPGEQMLNEIIVWHIKKW